MQTDPVTHAPALPSTDTYAAAFAKLSAIASKLKGSNSASIDTLAEDVRAARAAYAVCKARLSAIRAEIETETLDDTVEGRTEG